MSVGYTNGGLSGFGRIPNQLWSSKRGDESFGNSWRN